MEAGQALPRVTSHGEPGRPWVPVGVGVHTGLAGVGSIAGVTAAADFAYWQRLQAQSASQVARMGAAHSGAITLAPPGPLAGSYRARRRKLRARAPH